MNLTRIIHYAPACRPCARGVYWWIGSNLLSSWRSEGEEIWERNKAFLSTYHEANPVYPHEMEDDAHDDIADHLYDVPAGSIDDLRAADPWLARALDGALGRIRKLLSERKIGA